MRLTEANLRRVIREALRITNAPRWPIMPGEPSSIAKDPSNPFSLLGRKQHLARQVKKNFVPHPGFDSWIKVHAENPDDIVGELTRWNPRLEKSVYLFRSMEALARNPIPESGVPARGDIFILLSGGRITAMYDEDPMTEYIETPSGWRYYPGGVENEPEEEMWFSRGTSGEKWTIAPEEAPETWTGAPAGEQIYEASLVGASPEALIIKNPGLLAKRYDPKQTPYRPPPPHAPQSVQELVDTLFSLDIPILDAQGHPLSHDRLMSLVGGVHAASRVRQSPSKELKRRKRGR